MKSDVRLSLEVAWQSMTIDEAVSRDDTHADTLSENIEKRRLEGGDTR